MSQKPVREVVMPKGGPIPGPGMVPAIKAGGFIFVSAIRGIAPDGSCSDDTKEQARQAFENVKRRLAGADATLDHVVKVTLYMGSLEYRTPFHEVWMEYFPETPPARIAVMVADPNAMPGRNAHFALDVIALAP